MKFIKPLLLVILLVTGIGLLFGKQTNHYQKIEITNPYKQVDWQTFASHKADLHVHTLQSDGYHLLDEVLRAYKHAGFSILSITDHDWVVPNRHVRRGNLPAENASPYPDPKPENYPANTTWPWTDFGGQAPDEFGILGIEGSELSSRHHINSFFNDYGVAYQNDAPGEDEQLEEVGKRGGVAFLDHPGILADWWTRKPLEWYVERYRNHPVDYLVGMELSGGGY
jgi:hypothetical protein